MAGKTGSLIQPTQYKTLASGPIQEPNAMKMAKPVGQAPNIGPTPTQPTGGRPSGIDTMASNNEKINFTPKGGVGGAASGAVTNMANQYDQAKNLHRVDEAGNTKLGDPKVYDSVGDAGSGFVNLSHLLGLNKGSGEQSALDLAGRTREAGKSAQAGISGLEGQFNDSVLKQTQAMDNTDFTLGGSNMQDQINTAKNAQYTGPNDLTAMGAYGDLAKKVGSAQDMAKASQDAYGVAGQVNKETGLSPTQSAASAFYMGVNNPNIKRAGSPFTNLQKALDEANTRATQGSMMARNKASSLRDQSSQWQEQKDAYDNNPRAIGDNEREKSEYDNLVNKSNYGGATPEEAQEWKEFGDYLKGLGASTYGETHGGAFGGSLQSATLDNYKKWQKWKRDHK